jgi:hypothetical protein
MEKEHRCRRSHQLSRLCPIKFYKIIISAKTALPYSQQVSTESMAAGMYLLKVTVNNNVYVQKMIKAGE